MIVLVLCFILKPLFRASRHGEVAGANKAARVVKVVAVKLPKVGVDVDIRVIRPISTIDVEVVHAIVFGCVKLKDAVVVGRTKAPLVALILDLLFGYVY